MASNALQCNSLASARAWSCGSSLLTQVLQGDLVWQLGHKMLVVPPPNPLLAWQYPTSIACILPRKHRFPYQGPPSTLAHMVGGPVTSLAGYFIVDLPALLPGSSESLHPDGGNFHLSSCPRDWPLAALMNGSFTFFPSHHFSMYKHPLQDAGTMGAIGFPLRILMQEEFRVKAVFCLLH